MSKKCFFIILSIFLYFAMSKPLFAEPVLNGKGAVLLDAQSGQVLLKKIWMKSFLRLVSRKFLQQL